MLKFTELEKAFNEAKDLGFKYIGLKVKIEAFPDEEVVVIPRANFDSRLDYYKACFDENCFNYPDGDVQIVGVDYEDCKDALEFIID